MITIIRISILALLSFSFFMTIGQVDFGKVEIVEAAEAATATAFLPPHHHKITVV